MNVRKEVIRTAVLWGGLVVFMMSTRPSHMPVYLLFVPFIVLGLGVYSLWRLLVVIYTRTSGGHKDLSRKQQAAGIALSLLTAVSMGLQSIGEMTIRDLLTVTLLAVGAYFYFVRNLIRD